MTPHLKKVAAGNFHAFLSSFCLFFILGEKNISNLNYSNQTFMFFQSLNKNTVTLNIFREILPSVKIYLFFNRSLMSLLSR